METDYLIVGSGAVGMAFADTLLDESDAHITIVDRRAKPGGHWNDAYSFVTLHQPSAYYGVNSTELGSARKASAGPNQGLYELAGGAEVNTYFDQLMQHKFLPSGRVSYHPMSNYLGEGRIGQILSGVKTQVSVRRRTVFAQLMGPRIPATHTPKFTLAEGVRLVTPNALPQLWFRRKPDAAPLRFCVIGAGKTAMDAAVWLLRNGVAPDAVHWVVPRDSWLQNRLQTQPGEEFFDASIGGEADKLAAFAEGTSVDDVFLRLEAAGQMLRIDPQHKPTMFHFATISTGEVELLRTIRQVIRMGHVQAIEREALVLDQGRVSMAPDTLYVDCTASAIGHEDSVPVFQGDRILVQLVHAPLVVLSAAITAWVEVHGKDDAARNLLCTPLPFPHQLPEFARTMQMSLTNQGRWAQDKALRQWMYRSRLDPFGRLVAEVDRSNPHKMAVIERLRANWMPAMANLTRLMALA